MKRDDAVGRLKQHEADFRRLGVERLYMFGSTMRGDAAHDSDVDLFSITKKESSASSS